MPIYAVNFAPDKRFSGTLNSTLCGVFDKKMYISLENKRLMWYILSEREMYG